MNIRCKELFENVAVKLQHIRRHQKLGFCILLNHIFKSFDRNS